MPNLRNLAEKDMQRTVEGDWSLPVALLAPDGAWQRTRKGSTLPLTGQVLYDILRMDPSTGDRLVVNHPVVSLRRSSLNRIPQFGENWIVEIPTAPTTGAPIGQYALSPTRPPEGGSTLGFIRLYLHKVEQTPA